MSPYAEIILTLTWASAQCPVPQSFIPDHLEDAVCLWYIESVASTLLLKIIRRIISTNTV